MLLYANYFNPDQMSLMFQFNFNSSILGSFCQLCQLQIYMKYLIQQVLMVQYICLIQYILFNFFWYDLDKSGNKIGHEIMQQNALKRTKVLLLKSCMAIGNAHRNEKVECFLLPQMLI